MEIKVIFNNEAASSKFFNGWGFSCLVDGSVLFDTGEKSDYLFDNMARMNIDISHIEMVVISHDHWDHTGGLRDLLQKRKGIKVYSCPGFSQIFKDEVKKAGGDIKEAKGFIEIVDNVYVTGEIAGRYKDEYIAEQALVIKTKAGLIVITGCSHPGIIRIMEKVGKEFPEEKIKLAFGGFHLLDKDKREVKLIAEKLKVMKVEKVGPTHCTGYEAQMIFKEIYGDDFISIKAGQAFKI